MRAVFFIFYSRAPIYFIAHVIYFAMKQHLFHCFLDTVKISRQKRIKRGEKRWFMEQGSVKVK
jgi:hypothetical protein